MSSGLLHLVCYCCSEIVLFVTNKSFVVCFKKWFSVENSVSLKTRVYDIAQKRHRTGTKIDKDKCLNPNPNYNLMPKPTLTLTLSLCAMECSLNTIQYITTNIDITGS